MTCIFRLFVTRFRITLPTLLLMISLLSLLALHRCKTVQESLFSFPPHHLIMNELVIQPLNSKCVYCGVSTVCVREWKIIQSVMKKTSEECRKQSGRMRRVPEG